VEPVDLTLTEQVHEFSRAGIIVGTHGAGLTGQIYMVPGYKSGVVELLHNAAGNYHYANLAHNLMHFYTGECL
jgi:capsular polysaccharide biosynthesis protein